MSTKQESVSNAAFKHGHFHLILILPLEMVELPHQHANTTVHWLQAVPLPTVAKCSILNVAEFQDLSLKMLPCTEPSLTSCENQYFSYYFEMLPPFLKVIVFFCVTFYDMMKSQCHPGSVPPPLKEKKSSPP